MELYVGPLKSNATVHELQRFFKGYEKKAEFRIMKLIRSNGPHYFGIVDFDSDRLAQKAIKKTKRMADLLGRSKGRRSRARHLGFKP